MSAFHILEDVETSCVPDISKRKKSILEKQNGKTRSVLQPLSNGVKQDVKRAKFTINNQKTQEIKEKSKENLEKIKVIDEIGKIEKSNAIITSDEAEDDDHIPKSILYSIEYKQDIWNHLKYLEKFHPFPNSKYMLRQNDLCWRSRSILVDWLASVSHEYKLSNETFHLSVHYVDRFLMHMAVAKTKFQLVGAAAMLLAGKIEEVYPIDVKEWAYLTRDSFTPKQILKMEQLLTKILKFKMQPPTISTFIDHFCYEHQLDAKTRYLAMYLSELVLLEGNEYLNQLPSKLAAASIALARYTLTNSRSWPKKFKEHCGYSVKMLSPVLVKQQRTFVDSPSKEQQEIQNKYKTDKYHKVALIKPRKLVLELFSDE